MLHTLYMRCIDSAGPKAIFNTFFQNLIEQIIMHRFGTLNISYSILFIIGNSVVQRVTLYLLYGYLTFSGSGKSFYECLLAPSASIRLICYRYSGALADKHNYSVCDSFPTCCLNLFFGLTDTWGSTLVMPVTPTQLP